MGEQADGAATGQAGGAATGQAESTGDRDAGPGEGVRGPSLKGRFAVAVALTVVFYVLAIGIGLGLIALPILGWIELHHGNIWLTLFMIVAGFTVLRAIVPRRQPFNEPGLRIEPDAQPRLTEMITSVARATGQDPPHEVYANLDVNAGVTQVGGGLRGHTRRVLVLGLPLLRFLTVAELRAVLAHEFGHYAGGDTRIGSWTYRTRAVIGYTIASLHDEDSWGMRIVQRPFIWYGNAFLRITNAISRRQEFAADAWAARVAGRDANVSALRKLHRLAPAYDAYWAEEVAPVLQAGAVPPFGTGFARFVAVPHIAEACDKSLEQELGQAKTDPYSSHPNLAERLAAAEALPAGEGNGDESPAITLVDGPEELERATLDHRAKRVGAKPPEPVAWESVGERVYRPMYEQAVAKHGAVLEGVTTATFAAAASDPGAIARRAFGEGVRENTYPSVLTTLGSGLVLALLDQGWTLDAEIGRPVAVRRGDQQLEPFALVNDLVSGEVSAARWDEMRAELGIEDAPLAAARRVEEAVAETA
jgi:heat shock protein HtpX